MENFKIKFTTLLLALALFGNSVLAETSEKNISDNKDKSWSIDKVTGLWWQDDGFQKQLNWLDSLKYCKALNLDGQNDWRLPSKDELDGIYDRKDVLADIINKWYLGNTSFYWTRSSDQENNGKAWVKSLVNGNSETKIKTETLYVR